MTEQNYLNCDEWRFSSQAAFWAEKSHRAWEDVSRRYAFGGNKHKAIIAANAATKQLLKAIAFFNDEYKNSNPERNQNE